MEGGGGGVSTLHKSLAKDWGLFRCWKVLPFIQIMLAINLNIYYWHINFMTGPQLFKAV